MSDSVFDGIKVNPELVDHDLVFGGDSSVSDAGPFRFACYATAAARASRLPSITTALDVVVAKHADARDVEVHAVDIWNGSARAKAGFSQIHNKQDMLQFFDEWCRCVASTGIMATAAIYALPATERTSRAMLEFTRFLLYCALSRFDKNLKLTTGRHVGTPVLYHDIENRQLAVEERHISENRRGGFWDARPLRTNPLELTRTLDPHYVASDSVTHRLVQVADVAAYFTSKFAALSVFHDDPEMAAHAGRNISSEDIAICRSFLNIMNIEIVWWCDPGELDKQPPWLRRVAKVFAPLLALRAGGYAFSVREAFDNTGKPNQLWVV